MQAHSREFRLCAMCRVMKVNRAGYYAWLKTPMSERAKEDQRLLGLIKHQWLASGSVYGHRKVTDDLRDLGPVRGTDLRDIVGAHVRHQHMPVVPEHPRRGLADRLLPPRA